MRGCTAAPLLEVRIEKTVPGWVSLLIDFAKVHAARCASRCSGPGLSLVKARASNCCRAPACR